MGYATAVGLTDTELTLSDQIAIHFRSNCYPPIPLVMLGPAVEAVQAYWDDAMDDLIPLPEGVEFRDGRTSVPAYQVIESLRLDAWCVDDYEEDGEED